MKTSKNHHSEKKNRDFNKYEYKELFEHSDPLLYTQYFKTSGESGFSRGFSTKVKIKVQKSIYKKDDRWFAVLTIIIFLFAFAFLYLGVSIIDQQAAQNLYVITKKMRYVILFGVLSFLCTFYYNRNLKSWP